MSETDQPQLRVVFGNKPGASLRVKFLGLKVTADLAGHGRFRVAEKWNNTRSAAEAWKTFEPK